MLVGSLWQSSGHGKNTLPSQEKTDNRGKKWTLIASHRHTGDDVGMNRELNDIGVTVAGVPAAALPRCSGVYRFFSEEGSLLYIGKSVDIKSRVMQHWNEARKPGRHQRLMSQLYRVDCQLTAGEVGALLIENAAIKADTPLFNRRQRRLRRLWTVQLSPGEGGFLQPKAIDFAPTGDRNIETFGLFANKHRIDTAVRQYARDQGLCLRVLGLDRGKGPCFPYQLGHCDGACIGEEPTSLHNERLRQVLERQRIAAWPFAGPLLLAEHNALPTEGQPEYQFHLVDQWAWQGCFDTPAEARSALTASHRAPFDRDAYRLIFSALHRGRVALFDPRSGEPVPNPLLRSAVPSD